MGTSTVYRVSSSSSFLVEPALDVGKRIPLLGRPGLDVDRPRGVNPFATSAGHRHQRVRDIHQSVIATEAIRQAMEQAAEARLIGEGLRQPPEAGQPIAFVTC
jgi:hypothetical protein